MPIMYKKHARYCQRYEEKLTKIFSLRAFTFNWKEGKKSHSLPVMVRMYYFKDTF